MTCQKSLKSSQQSIPSYTSITVTGAPSENIDEAVDNEVVFEFGGPLGVTAMMIGFPPLMYYLWGCLNFYGGAIVSPLNLDLWKQIIDGAYPTWHATTIYILFALFQLFLAYAMPGPIVQGAPVPSLKGRKLDYLCNGLTSWYVSLIVSFVLHVYGWFRLTEVIDEFGRLMTAAIMTAFTLTIVVYVVTVATNKQHRMSGYLMYDLFMGAPLNPRIRHVDLKMFVEVRITWVSRQNMKELGRGVVLQR